jgi:DNA transformation protein
MPVTNGFVEFVLEQLDPIGPITPKRMFGGVGLYAGDLFFALIAGDVLYLKADVSTRGELEAAGARPFQPYPDRRGGTMQYYSVSAAILEDSDELIAWAKKSVAVARVQGARAPARRRRVKPKRSRKRTRRLGSPKRSRKDD